jgi:ABC-type transporter lipoprotein component MlaA/pimeloyl-ACP methyl ester carboxylesterase
VLPVLSVCLSTLAHAQTIALGCSGPAAESVVLPGSIPDPLEPWNRAVWAFNNGVMTTVIRPTSKAYRFVVGKPVRTGIRNVGHNLTYPARLLNNLLQGRWSGARDESYRFLCNTTVGVGGFLDVATKWNVPRSDADFGQTLGHWGWKPACFLMLPFVGPSSERDTLGLAADTAANPLLYLSPYEFVASQPLTYLGPYSYVAYAVKYNDLTDSVGEYVRFSQAEMDPYSTVHLAWTFARDTRAADFQVTGPPDSASLATLESAFSACEDPEFPGRGKTRSVLMPATGRKLPFTFWLQPGQAPVVYIVPGLGSHRLAQASVALAELVYQSGFSAVCISSAFHSEFMEHASTAAVPGYLPVDGHDVHVALTEVDRRLRALFPRRLGDKALLGYSMGAFHALFTAATEPTNPLPLIAFDRYVAINPPVQMAHGISKLDEFYRAPLDWPGAERTSRMENTFLKVAALSKRPLPPQTSLPFSAIESRFLIGLTFRLILRDIIFSSQRRHPQGVLQRRTKNLRRLPVYQEILQYSYEDYFQAFVVPYYQARGLAAPTAETLEHAGDLRTYAAGLRANPNLRIIINQDDFLLADEDLTWLQSTFTAQTLTVFDQGGHLGNLFTPAVRESILRALADLRPPREASD